MPLYHYSALDPSGRKRAGRMEAHTLVELEQILKRIELDLIDGSTTEKFTRFRSHSLPRRELLHFCFHLDLLIRAGIPLLDGLCDLRDTADNRRVRAVVASLIEAIEGGLNLSGAMAAQPRVFSEVFVGLIRAGESSGRLSDILRNYIDSLKWEDELASQTQKILVYPAFVGAIVLAALLFLMLTVVPQLKHFVHSMGEELPIQTRLLFFVSDALIAYWPIFLLAPPLIVLLCQAILRTNPSARWVADHIKLRIPVLGEVLRKIILSRFANTFALLYAADIAIIDSIQSSQKVVGNLVIRRGLELAEQSITEGANVATAFHDTGFFPPLVIRMLRIGETTGALDDALLNISYFYTRDIRESVAKTQQLIEPVLTLLLGSLLAWIMLAVLGPVYSVISTLKF